MRTIFSFAVVLVVLSFTTVDARADGPWCARDIRGGTNCGFHSYAQCMINLSGIGGICERNQFYRAPDNRRRPRDR